VHRPFLQEREDRRADVAAPCARTAAAARAGEELKWERAPRAAAMVMPPPVGPFAGECVEHWDTRGCSVI
jgi:hypothetical protein